MDGLAPTLPLPRHIAPENSQRKWQRITDVSWQENNRRIIVSPKPSYDMIRQKAQGRKNNETDVLLVIKSKTGHRISEFSKFTEQRELLFDKGMRLKFDGFRETKGSRIIFQMTEI